MNQNDEFAGFSAPESRKTECPKLLVPVGEEELHRVAVSMMVRINQLETERKGLLAELKLLRQGGEVIRKLLLEAYDEGETPGMPIHYRMTQGLNQLMGAGADLVEFIKFIQAETEHVEVEDDEIPF